MAALTKLSDLKHKYGCLFKAKRIFDIFHIVANSHELSSFLSFAKESGYSYTISTIMHRFRFLGSYLTRAFTHRERCLALGGHYKFMTQYVDGKMFLRLEKGEETLYECESDPQLSVSIGMATSTKHRNEGEFILNFLTHKTRLYSLIFSIVPGSLFGLDDSDVIFIGASQGCKGEYEAIRSATRANHDVSPQACLVTAVQAIGAAMGIFTIVGVSVNNQLSIGLHKDPLLHRTAYDDLWIASGGTAIATGDFRWSSKQGEKPLNEIKRGHRIRTKQKRQYKQSMFARIQATFDWILHHPVGSCPEVQLAVLEPEKATRIMANNQSQVTRKAPESIISNGNSTVPDGWTPLIQPLSPAARKREDTGELAFHERAGRLRSDGVLLSRPCFDGLLGRVNLGYPQGRSTIHGHAWSVASPKLARANNQQEVVA